MTDIPIDIGRDEARDAAVRELSDPAYAQAEPTWPDRLLHWLADRLRDLFEGLGRAVPGGVLGLLIIALVVLVVIVVIRLRVGRLARTARAGAVFAGGPRAAAEHRQSAEEALARGDIAEAVRERFRAIVRGLEERGVLDERSGRTVDEVAVEAGRRLPEYAPALRTAARSFDDIWYGGRTATMDAYLQLAELDLRLAGAVR
jgi:uncharacterized membrane protein